MTWPADADAVAQPVMKIVAAANVAQAAQQSLLVPDVSGKTSERPLPAIVTKFPLDFYLTMTRICLAKASCTAILSVALLVCITRTWT